MYTAAYLVITVGLIWVWRRHRPWFALACAVSVLYVGTILPVWSVCHVSPAEVYTENDMTFWDVLAFMAVPTGSDVPAADARVRDALHHNLRHGCIIVVAAVAAWAAAYGVTRRLKPTARATNSGVSEQAGQQAAGGDTP